MSQPNDLKINHQNKLKIMSDFELTENRGFQN